jgi:hypothetical protein
MALLLTTTAIEHRIDSLDWPRCDKCQMPVQQFSVYESSSTGITFVATCHGEEQTVTVPNDVLIDMLGSHVGFGTAFTEENSR